MARFWSFAYFLITFLLISCSPQISPSSTAKFLPTQTITPLPQRTEVEIIDPLAFPSAGIELVGRLYLPIGEGPFPAVVMVHGSGFRTRDESVNLATRLVDTGIAVFRYDKRGVGDSGGAYEGVSTGNSNEILRLLAADAVNAIHFLQTFPEIDPQKIGLFGNSQAGWIMPISAASSSDVAFAVLLVGPTVSVGIENRYSSLTREKASNTTAENLDAISLDLAEFDGQHGYDPRSFIEAINVPALWVLGGRDASIPTRETLAILEEIKAELLKDFDFYIYPLGTHSLANTENGELFDFMSDIVLDWIHNIVD